MKERYWVCAYTAGYAGRAAVLKASVEKHTAHKFVPHGVSHLETDHSPADRSVVLARLIDARDLLKRGAYEVIVSGADYCVYSRLDELNHEYESYGALFCPHTTVLPMNAWTMMRSGAINSDFQVWRAEPGVVDFLNTLIHNLSVGSPVQTIFEHEQHWLPFALAQCNGKLITHPGYGMAFYNLHERSLDVHQRVRGAGATGYLRTFHFTGMDFHKSATQLSRHQGKDMRLLTQYEHTLAEEYRKKVLAST